MRAGRIPTARVERPCLSCGKPNAFYVPADLLAFLRRAQAPETVPLTQRACKSCNLMLHITYADMAARSDAA